MIDLKLLRDDPDLVRASQRARGEDPGLVDALLAADERRRAAVSAADNLRGESNIASKAIQSASKDDRPGLIERAGALKAAVKEAEVEQGEAEAELRRLHLALPNVVEGAPPGGEDDYLVLEHVGEPPAFDFEPKDHLDLGEGIGAIDMGRGAKVSGARFFYLTGVGAQLEFGLWQLAMAQAVAAGFTR